MKWKGATSAAMIYRQAAPEGTDSRSYQRELRALGANLDEEGPDRFSLIEVPDGFEVIVHNNASTLELDQHHYTHDELEAQARDLMAGKRRGRGVPKPWNLAGTTRQDFLRALGFELDDSEAHGVILDELDGELMVTYSYLDPAQGFSWRKRMVRLSGEQMGEIRSAAYSRRQHRRRWLPLP